MDSPATSPTPPAKPARRLHWLLVAAIGLGLAVAGLLIDKVAWPQGMPEAAKWIGRFHPLVLHFPIVLLLIALVFELARLPVLRWFLPKAEAPTTTAILAWGAAGATLAAACGWLLAQGGGYEGGLLDRHLQAGTATALGANLALLLRLSNKTIGKGFFNVLADIILIATCAAMTLAGHYGASLTHGGDYLTEMAPDPVREFLGLKPRHKSDAGEIKPVGQRLLWDDVVQPILEERCAACHNPAKPAGGLHIDTPAALLKGGASGPAIVPGKPADSLVIQRLQLPVDDDKHMPPKGKPQLTGGQLAALSFWIENGAPADKAAGDFELTDPIRAALDSLLTPAQQAALESKTKAAAAALESTLASLRKSLPGRLACVVPGKPDLAYTAGIHAAEVGDPELAALAPVAANVVTLELQQSRITDAGLAALAPFTNLRNLQIQNTNLTDAGLVHVARLASLETLNLYGTGVTDAGLQQLESLKKLKNIHLWQSKATAAGAAKLREAIPGVVVDLGLAEEPKPETPPAKDTPAPPAGSNKP